MWKILLETYAIVTGDTVSVAQTVIEFPSKATRDEFIKTKNAESRAYIGGSTITAIYRITEIG